MKIAILSSELSRSLKYQSILSPDVSRCARITWLARTSPFDCGDHEGFVFLPERADFDFAAVAQKLPV